MDENKITTRQLVLFTVVLSFITSVLGTILALGVLGSLFGFGEETGSPFVFNRPKILEKITERITQKEEKVLRQDELVVNVVEEASPAVVSVVASKDVPVVEQFFIDPFGDSFGEDPLLKQFFGSENFGLKIPQLRQKGTEKREISSGTGFLVSSDGVIITNKHVVADTEAEYTAFLNDGSKKPAKILARDPLQDFAVLKIEGKNLPALRLGDSGHIKIGQTVVVIGNALGEFRNTVSVGVISGLHRSLVAHGSPSGPESLEELIQTDAAINPGNSGGPLLNIDGDVIGINTAMAQGAENIGFSIPVNKIKRALENVKQRGRIIYPFLGIRYMVITKDFAEKQKLGRDYGVLISHSGNDPTIVAGSPADKAGLKEGDIVLAINKQRIDSEHTLASLIQSYNVGDEVTLNVFRDGKELDVKVVLEERTPS